MTLVYRSTLNRKLTVAEGDGNILHLANASAVSVKNYGAVGDGVTDDTAAIQAAITAVGKGNVYFPGNGVYVATGLSVSSDGVALIGDSLYGARLRFLNTTGTLLTVTGALFNMRDFEIESPAATHTAGSIIDVQGGQGSVSNIRITGSFWDCFKLETAGKGGWFFEDIRVVGGNTLNSLFRVKGTGSSVADNHVRGLFSATNSVWTEAAIILDTYTDTFEVSGGTLGGNGKLVHIKDSGAGVEARYIHFNGVFMEDSAGAGDAVTIDAGDDIRFTNGYVALSVNAFVVNAGRDIAIHNNHLLSIKRSALDLNGGARVSFKNNTLLDCSQETDVTYSSVDVAANVSEWQVEGNTLRLRSGTTNKPLRQLTIASGTSNKFSYGDNDWGIAGTDFGAAGANAVSDGSTGTSVVITDSIPTLLYRGGAAVTHTGGTGSTVLITGTIPAGGLRTRDGIEIFAAGTTVGTAGTKDISLTFGGTVVSTIQVPGANTDTWTLRAVVYNANSVSGQSFMGQATRTAADTEGTVVRNKSAGDTVDTTAAVAVTVTGQLSNAADSIVVRVCDMKVVRR